MYNSHIAARWAAVGLLMAPAFMANVASAEAVDPGTPTVSVKYHDLNLQTEKGVRRLYRRIHVAAVAVCKAAEGPQLVNHVFWTDWNACLNKAVGDAVGSVRNHQLSAYYLSKN